MIPILDLKRQYEQIGKEIEKDVIDVLRSGCYILGPHNKALEVELSEFIGVKHAVGGYQPQLQRREPRREHARPAAVQCRAQQVPPVRRNQANA